MEAETGVIFSMLCMGVQSVAAGSGRGALL